MRRRLRLTGMLLACCSAGLLALAATASARQIHTYTAGATFNGATSTAGAFTNQLGRLDIIHANGNVLVQNGNRVIQFDAAGNPVPFSALGAADFVTIPPGTPPQVGITRADVEVDNNPSSTGFGFYVGGDNKNQAASFNFDGTSRPFVHGATGPSCGIGVRPDGTVVLSTSAGGGQMFNPLAEDVGNFHFIGANQGHGACYPDFDSANHGYIIELVGVAGTGPGLVKFEVGGLPCCAHENQFNFTNNQQNVAVDVSNDNVFALTLGNRVTEYNSEGAPLFTFGGPAGPFAGLTTAVGVAVNPTSHTVYVAARGPGTARVQTFTQDPGTTTVPTVTTTPAVATPTTAVLNGVVNPDGIETTTCKFEWGTTAAYAGAPVDCSEGKVFAGSSDNNVSAPIGGLGPLGTEYHYRVTSTNANGISAFGVDRNFRASNPPVITDELVSEVNTDSARFSFDIDPQGSETSYSLELEECAPACAPIALPDGALVSHLGNQHGTRVLAGLAPGTEHKVRVVARNDAGTVPGPVQKFITFPLPEGIDECGNAQVRQQTGSSLLFDCRSYELVSARNAGGYDVESDVVPGQEPLPAQPLADDRALYSLHFGLVPGIEGSPTNFGRDPYVATRGPSGWSTKYVGLPSDGMASSDPFGSEPLGTDGGLNVFAFGGPDICDPCFGDGSTNIPVRLGDGSLIQGIAGSLAPGPADPAGEVRRHLSEDGSHLIFGTTTKIEPAGNGGGDVTIYDRNLDAGTTQVVSTLPGGATMTGPGIAALDVSDNGSRVLVGKLVSADGAGNEYFDLYMHVGTNANSVQVLDSASGALYAGMSSDGTKVYFTTPDPVDSDTDSSVDLYRANVGSLSATIERVSFGGGAGDTDACNPVANTAGNNWNAVGGASPDTCGVVAIGGGGGVSASGPAYFLTPEALNGGGTLNQPNLYFGQLGASPQFVATLEPDNPAVLNSVADSEVRRTADFQVTSDGDYAVFTSVLSLTGYPNIGHSEIFRFDSVFNAVDCASCPPTNAGGTGDASLASAGLNITDDGIVFFTTAEPLVLRDTNGKKDAYEWKDGESQIVSTGKEPTDSGMLSVSADGLNAFFFTRQTLVNEDENGATVKIYTARADGGYLYDPPSFPCAASDECHGPGTQPGPAPPINTVTGSEGVTGPRACRRSHVRKNGTCVKKKKKKKQRRRSRSTRHNQGR